MKLHIVELERDGYSIRIQVHHAEHMGEPWKEHGGHGIVSDWTRRDKQPGELVLARDGDFIRFYDLQATLEIAKRDGWGMCDEHKKELARKLGHKPTRKEVTHAAVMSDYEHLRGWCNDEWQWLGYTTTIIAPDGQKLDGDSCWGFDDEEYMMGEAKAAAFAAIRVRRADIAARSSSPFGHGHGS
jgi:hypothetical protein